jgi:hypothetical protein
MLVVSFKQGHITPIKGLQIVAKMKNPAPAGNGIIPLSLTLM